MKSVLKSIVLATVCFAAAFGQKTKPVIDNERVTVWDVTVNPDWCARLTTTLW